MLVHYIVYVDIRKGLGPEIMHKKEEVVFDDLPECTTDYEVEMMVKAEVNSRLRNTEDYRLYGKNWQILEREKIQ